MTSTHLLSLFRPFLPCTSDWQTLLIMADIAEENGDLPLAKHLRWTSREWEWGRGLRRENCVEGMTVWARYASMGWSRGVIAKVTPTHIHIGFPSSIVHTTFNAKSVEIGYPMMLED